MPQSRSSIRCARAAVLALLLSVALTLPPPAAAEVTLDEDTRRILTQVNGYLNRLGHLQGRFAQVNPDGSLEQGVFYLRRPGRARFQYDPPNPLLVVADGTWVVVQESGEGPAQRYPLSQTPLALVLADKVDLVGEALVEEVVRQKGSLQITLRDRSAPDTGQVVLVFDQPRLALRQWTLTDVQGLHTTVTLSELVAGRRADNALFTVDESKSPFIRDYRRR